MGAGSVTSAPVLFCAVLIERSGLADTPYAVLLVQLAEGPRMISSLVEADHGAVAIGMAVEIVFDAVTDQVTLPRFRPARAGA